MAAHPTINWLDKPELRGHVKDQGERFNCWAITVAYAVGSRNVNKKRIKSRWMLSSQYLMDNFIRRRPEKVPKKLNGRITMDNYKNYPLKSKDALDYVFKFGIPYESAYPYTGQRDCSQKSAEALKKLRKKLRMVFISGYSELGCTEQDSATKEKIYEGVGRGPLLGTINVTNAFVRFKGDHILRPEDCPSSGSEFDPSKDDSSGDDVVNITHAVVIVGMDYDANFFYVQNSQGPSWGVEGIGKVDCNLIYDILEPHITDGKKTRRFQNQPSFDSPKTECQQRELKRLGAVASGSAAAVKSSSGSMPCCESSDALYVRRSAASMLSGKKPVQVAPADMGLEVIESRLGSLIQAETNSLLKSAVCKERVEAIVSLKELVEAIQNINRSVEILIRFLCVVPGWNEKNVQVQQQVIEVTTHIASTATKLSKVCVVLCIQGVSERIADIKMSAHAMRCLTTFCESVGPAFIFERIRIESIEAVNKILEEANMRVQPSGTVELFGVLRGRLYARNHNLIMATLSTIGGIASAMGLAVEKASKGILSNVLKCLGDNKKHMQECTLTTLDLWLADVHLDKTVPYVVAALMDAKIGTEGRRVLFEWLSRELAGLKDFSDNIHLLKPVATAIMDKSADVRRAAEVCFAEKLKWHETVTKNVTDIQGPALGIVLDRLKPYGASQETYESTRTISIAPPSKSGLNIGKSNGAVSKHSRDLAPRGALAKGARPETIIYVKNINIHSQALLNTKVSDKGERERLIVRRFKFDEPRLEQIQDLESDLLKYFRDDLHRRLLSTDFKKRVDGIDMLQKALPSISRDTIEVLDVLLRWFVLRLCESNTPCVLKVLEFFS